jgi:hypothetical protein
VEEGIGYGARSELKVSRIDQNSIPPGGEIKLRRKAMPQQFENPAVTKVEDATVSKESTEKANERVAEEAAQKAVKSVQKYDKDHNIISI